MGFKNAQNFNYERSINPSHAQFYYLDGGGTERPLPLHDQSVVGAFGSYTSKDADLKSRLTNPNPQRVDMALLPLDADTVRIRFSLSVVDNALEPRTCNDSELRENMRRFASSYYRADGFRTLADRYHRRILDGGWFWRNRKLATDKRVWVKDERGELIADVEPDGERMPESAALQEGIRAALAGETGPFRVLVTGEGVMGPGQEVHPSQEFVDPNRQTGAAQSSKSRHLACVSARDPVSDQDVRQAIFHPQKIGNHLRRVDDWYSENAEYGLIPAEPYGMMLNRFHAVRWPSEGKDLYSHLQDKRLEELIGQVDAAGGPEEVPGDAHFVMACLIRGGVFSAESKK